MQLRMKRIHKGATDYDGNTSSSEEGTFIETLLSEIPEIEEKEKHALNECISISEKIALIQRDMDKSGGDDSGDVVIQVLQNMEEVDEQLLSNEKTVVFLEKLASKLEQQFIDMNVRKKIEKRALELKELENIGEDFSQQLDDLEQHIQRDIYKLEENKKVQGTQQMMNLFVDE